MAYEVFMAPPQRKISSFLESSSPFVFTLYACFVSFCVYFCMYAFRKPFAAASYEGLSFWGLELKTVFVISQILGYTLSKYIGIKICPETKPHQRAYALIVFILIAEGSLLLFAILPIPFKIAAIFLNGIPLGMVWGLVVWYLEGRRVSEILLACLSCSFIVSSGTVKDVGIQLMERFSVPEFWMPFATGLCFLPFFILFVWLLDQIPKPNLDDEAMRVKRGVMDGSSRKRYLLRFLGGMVLLFCVYFFLTAYRDFRDNYGLEILLDLGYEESMINMIFSRTEWPVAFGVLFAMGCLNLIRNNKWGMIGTYGVMLLGTVLMGVSTLLLDAGQINGLWWITLVGLGSYLAYVPYNSVLFDRTVAATRVTGTAVFSIYVADAIGYTGSVATQFYKDLGQSALSRFEFFRGLTYTVSIISSIILFAACIYFINKVNQAEKSVVQPDDS